MHIKYIDAKVKLNIIKCEAILNSGKRKGEKCGCNLNNQKNKDNKRCGKHLKLTKDI